MKLTYDPATDALYLSLGPAPSADSEEIRPGLVLDYDANDNVVGIEILRVRQLLPEADISRLQTEVLTAAGAK
ncbi:MAG: DUF2283 domain-containing protein [Phycisphaerae bacterium]